jgi:hypothetical protein
VDIPHVDALVSTYLEANRYRGVQNVRRDRLCPLTDDRETRWSDDGGSQRATTLRPGHHGCGWLAGEQFSAWRTGRHSLWGRGRVQQSGQSARRWRIGPSRCRRVAWINSGAYKTCLRPMTAPHTVLRSVRQRNDAKEGTLNAASCVRFVFFGERARLRREVTDAGIPVSETALYGGTDRFCRY